MKPGIEALATRCRVITFSLADEPTCRAAFEEATGFDCYVEQVREALNAAGLVDTRRARPLLPARAANADAGVHGGVAADVPRDRGRPARARARAARSGASWNERAAAHVFAGANGAPGSPALRCRTVRHV